MTPSELYKKKVIGKIYCQLSLTIDGQLTTFPVDEYDVIELAESAHGKVYVCNQWHKQGVPQFVSENFVIKFEPLTKYLFLDFDGVMNSDQYSKVYTSPYITPDLLNIDPQSVKLLNDLMNIFPDIKIIISSSWRNYFSIDDIATSLKEKGFNHSQNIIDKTPKLSNQKREEEILFYLKDKSNYEFVVLDDGSDLEKVNKNLIKTNMADGLQEHHIKQICKIFK